jgi:hypothetical protein
MNARLFERFRWVALLATVTALAVAGPAIAAVPRATTYSGKGTSSAGARAKVELQVTVSRRGRVHVKIVKATDGCFGPSTDGARTEVRNGRFAASFGGGTPAAGFSDQFSGEFFSSRSGNVKLHTVSWNYPATGPATTCDVTSTIQIHRLKHNHR